MDTVAKKIFMLHKTSFYFTSYSFYWVWFCLSAVIILLYPDFLCFLKNNQYETANVQAFMKTRHAYAKQVNMQNFVNSRIILKQKLHRRKVADTLLFGADTLDKEFSNPLVQN